MVFAEIQIFAIDKARAVLIIVQTKHSGEVMVDALKKRFDQTIQIRSFLRDDQQTFDGWMRPGDVLVSTMLMGRGVDTRLTQELAANGGLHEIDTCQTDSK